MKPLGFLRVAAAMPRVHVADPAANAREIIHLCNSMADEHPSVVVFPELCVTGYTCADLFGQNRLLADAEAAVAEIVAASAKLQPMIVVGAPVRYAGRLFNCAVAIRAGRILGIVPKTYLAGNGEFYEPRWFASARVLSPAGSSIRFAGQEDVLIGVHQLFRIGEQAVLTEQVGSGVAGDAQFRENDDGRLLCLQILTQLEDLPGIRRRVGYVHARHGRRHTDESKTLHRRKDSGFALGLQTMPYPSKK